MRHAKECRTELMQAITGLSDFDNDMIRAPGKWSIREIVHLENELKQSPN